MLSKGSKTVRYTIGIDTGGTYTDAVIIDITSRKLIASAKALTTKGDLSIGIIESLKSVINSAGDSFDQSAISTVCLSTTLATNALVEGHGARVGVFLIGFDDAMVERSGIAKTVDDVQIIRIDGGHRYTGQERNPLALEQVTLALKNLQIQNKQIDTYAVTSHYAIRNTEHEQQVKKLIEDTTSQPVTASWEISNALNDPLRALTTTLNARMIPLISALKKAVEDSLIALNINADIMIVKGDGSIGSAQAATLKPIETILSGPAASVIGAKFLTGLTNFAIVDIGGTTSDIAMIKDGWPRIVDRGAVVGGHHTLVKAIDVKTIGLGGDSEVLIDSSGKISIGNNRVVPISLLAQKWPWIEKKLEYALVNNRSISQASHYIFLPDGSNALSADSNESLSEKDREFLQTLDPNQPKHFYDVIISASDRACLARLLKQGRVQISGVTPSDAAHAIELQSQWSNKAAMIACNLLARTSGRLNGLSSENERKQFAQEIIDLVVAKSSKLVIECLAGIDFNDKNILINTLANGTRKIGNLTVSLSPNINVVAVGGPASIIYPEVAKRLNCEIIIPKGNEVANAIGAAVSMIKVRAIVEITHTEDGEYIVHHHGKPECIQNSKDAIDRASELATQQAQHEVKTMGGCNFEITLMIKRIDLPGIDPESSLMAATITAELIAELN